MRSFLAKAQAKAQAVTSAAALAVSDAAFGEEGGPGVGEGESEGMALRGAPAVMAEEGTRLPGVVIVKPRSRWSRVKVHGRRGPKPGPSPAKNELKLGDMSREDLLSLVHKQQKQRIAYGQLAKKQKEEIVNLTEKYKGAARKALELGKAKTRQKRKV